VDATLRYAASLYSAATQDITCEELSAGDPSSLPRPSTYSSCSSSLPYRITPIIEHFREYVKNRPSLAIIGHKPYNIEAWATILAGKVKGT
jgi:hypothetical protein